MRKNLRAARRNANLTQYAIAQELGISRSYYSQIEVGAKNVPRGWKMALMLLLHSADNDLFENDESCASPKRGAPYKNAE